jgi:hypothetical protein
MKVFATNYLEKMSSDSVEKGQVWTWKPEGGEADQIYASGANTRTNQSTYAAERDNRSDSDRPNEGMFVA